MQACKRLARRVAWMLPLFVVAAVHAQVPAQWQGLWMGRTSGARELDIIVEVLGEATPTVKVSLPGAGIIDEPFSGVTVDATTLKASWNPGIGKFSFELALTDSKPVAAQGNVTMAAPGLEQPMVLPMRLTKRPRAESVPSAESWVADLELPNSTLKLGLTLARAPDGVFVGSFSVPEQKLIALPVDVEQSSGVWNIRVPVGEPARMLLAPVENRLEGRFQQGTADLAVVFTRGEAAKRAGRPQTPVEPLPYSATNVVIPHTAGHVLGATLTLPPNASPQARVPGVVLATGSGPQDRNETLAEVDQSPFLVLSDALTRAGIAVLRFDDRGVGESTGSFSTATSLDFATDLNAAFEFMKQQPAVDPTRVGVLGHSEGATLAAIVAANAVTESRANPPAFVVLMAGPGMDGNKILRTQNEAILRAKKVAEPQLVAMCDAQKALLDGVVAGADDATLRPLAARLITLQLAEQRATGMPVPPAQEAALVTQTIASLRTPWMTTFLKLDPLVYMRRIKAPTLAINGSLDTQVVAKDNLPAIREALKQAAPNSTVREYPGLNHLFQPAKTGDLEEYAKIDITMDPQVLRDVAEWIRGTTRTTTRPADAKPPESKPAAATPAGSAPTEAVPAGAGR
jgi:fermentation-respiration switch protein FrsA (DUF1100 family)